MAPRLWLKSNPAIYLKGSEVVPTIPGILDEVARRTSETQKARQAPVPDENKTEPVEDINGLESVTTAGSWGDQEAEDPQYGLEARRDPSEMNTDTGRHTNV